MFHVLDSCDCNCLDRNTPAPALDNTIKKSPTVLRKSSSDNKIASNGRRRGSLPSPPLQPFSIKESIHRVRKESISLEEEPDSQQTNHDIIVDPEDFPDEEEEELLVLFEQNDDQDDNQESDEEENSWSPSPLTKDNASIDDLINTNDTKNTSIKTERLEPPVLEEENGKIKVTEKFMRDLIR